MRSKFYVAKVDDRREIVWIIDICTSYDPMPMSVTNDAEAVCYHLNLRYPCYRIIYKDTEDRWDELVHDNGVFKTFAPASHLALD